MNIQDWFPLGLTGLISFKSKGFSRVFSNTTVQKHQLFRAQLSLFFIVQLSHPYMTTGKTIALIRWTIVSKEIPLLLNMFSTLVIAFLPRSKCLLISWLQSPSAVILDPKEIKSLTVSIVYPSTCHGVMGPDAMILVFWMLSFKPTFFTLLFQFHQEALYTHTHTHTHVQVYMYMCTMSRKEGFKHNVDSPLPNGKQLLCIF